MSACTATPPIIAAKPPTKIVAASNSHHATPAQVTPSPTPTKRGHMRSASLENANSFISKNTLGLPIMQTGNTGTLKSRNEQKRLRSKFGSHSNLEDYVQQGRSKFQNIRQMFEISRNKPDSHSLPTATAAFQALQQQQQQPQQQPQKQPQQYPQLHPEQHSQQQQQQPRHQPQQPQQHTQQQEPQQHPQHHTQHQSPQLPLQQQIPTQSQVRPQAFAQQQQQAAQQQLPSLQCHSAYQQQYAAQQQQQQQHNFLQQHRKSTPTTTTGCGSRHSIADVSERLSIIECADGTNINKNHQQQAQPQQKVPQQQQQRSASGLEHLHSSENQDQATNLLRPIAFKPIPFEPDYSIPTRYCDVVGDRYGSTPSLAPVQGSNLRFGSTTDLRHGGGAGLGVGVYSSTSYCNSLMARRRGSRSLKINDSMESIRHTPDSDATSQSSTIKSNCSNMMSSSLTSSCNNNNNNKYMLSEQCDMTPSPSDSGISDLEAALKDRDSELSYLRQTMEHNEKDKEAFWENETKRLKIFYEGQQREYLLKLKKMEQMLAMQQFQFKQNKLRLTESSCKIKEQLADLKNENDVLRGNNSALKNSESNLKDRAAFLEGQLSEGQCAIANLKAQLEESEWKICERNGEIALLKTQLKEANVEITLKEHALVHLKHENINAESQIYQSLQENNKIAQQQRDDEQQLAQSQRETETELKQLNKIIILKDQVILALTNELAKLRKELSDLAIYHEYGEEPSGKFTRLKHQLDNLTDICARTRRHVLQSEHMTQEKVIDDINLEVIMNCLKIAPSLAKTHNSNEEEDKELALVSAEQRLAKMSADIQKFVYGSQNLPDVAVNVKSTNNAQAHFEESTLDTLIAESSNYAAEIGKLRKQLDDVRENFEIEKLQWCEEREKVLSYQKQLQTHYINMYQKLRSLQKVESHDV